MQDALIVANHPQICQVTLRFASLSESGAAMPKAQQLLDGTLTGYPPPTLSVMKEAFAKGWPLIFKRYQGAEATAGARLRLAGAIVAVTAPTAASSDDIARMAIDLVTIEERDRKPE